METTIEKTTNVALEDNQTNSSDNSVSISELEKLTNESNGWVKNESEQKETTDIEESPEPNNEETIVENKASKKEASSNGQAKTNSNDDISSLAETPYKSIKDIVKGYKNLQSELTKKGEKFKNFESVSDRLDSDANFKQFYEQALALYDNPQLAQAYANPQAGKASTPDPREYDLYSDEGLQKYNQDLSDYQSRQLDERLNARFRTIDQRDSIERARLHLKESFPDAKAEEVEKFITEKNGRWNLSDVYKIMAYDNLKENASVEARKNIQQKMEMASNASPATSASSSSAVNSEDVVRHIIKHGIDSARKKYGSRETMSAQSDYTNNNSY